MPSPGAVGTVELEKAMHTTIRADRALDGLILLHRGFGQQKSELEHFESFSISFFYQVPYCLFVQSLGNHAVLSKPPLYLGDGIGVFETGQFICSGCCRSLYSRSHSTACSTSTGSTKTAPVVDVLIHKVIFLLRRRVGECPYFRRISRSTSTSRMLYWINRAHLSGASSGRLRVRPPLAFVALHGTEK